MMYALMTSPWYFLDLRCSLRTERNLVVDLLAAIFVVAHVAVSGSCPHILILHSTQATRASQCIAASGGCASNVWAGGEG